MKIEQIENDLRTWFEYVTNKFSWLNIRYEFNPHRNAWLVSFSPANRIDLSEEFNKEAMDFEDAMYEKYELDAPLFTDEEKLFKLSPWAKTFGLQSLDCSKTSILREKKKELTWSASVSSLSSTESGLFPNMSNHVFSFVKVA